MRELTPQELISLIESGAIVEAEEAKPVIADAIANLAAVVAQQQEILTELAAVLTSSGNTEVKIDTAPIARAIARLEMPAQPQRPAYEFEIVRGPRGIEKVVAQPKDTAYVMQ